MSTCSGRTKVTMEEEKTSPPMQVPVINPASEKHEEAAAPIFEIEDVTVRYSGKLAVKEVTFDLPTNRITALIGRSGLRPLQLTRRRRDVEAPRGRRRSSRR